MTIAGQSAGSHSVSLHVVSPGSGGYFGRAIMQSGSASARWPTLADAEALGKGFAAAVGCTDPALVLDCMRSKPRIRCCWRLETASRNSPTVDVLPGVRWSTASTF